MMAGDITEHEWLSRYIARLIELGWNADVADSLGRVAIRFHRHIGHWPNPETEAEDGSNPESESK